VKNAWAVAGILVGADTVGLFVVGGNVTGDFDGVCPGAKKVIIVVPLGVFSRVSTMPAGFDPQIEVGRTVTVTIISPQTDSDDSWAFTLSNNLNSGFDDTIAAITREVTNPDLVFAPRAKVNTDVVANTNLFVFSINDIDPRSPKSLVLSEATKLNVPVEVSYLEAIFNSVSYWIFAWTLHVVPETNINLDLKKDLLELLL